MKVVYGFALAVLCVLQITAIPTSFVENGQVAEGQKHAVIVLALQRVGAHRANFGSGNIITERHILTCAHLVHRAKEFRLAYGETKARETIRLRARSALIHSHFNQETLENDLAVITLSQGQVINKRLGTPVAISCRGLFSGDVGFVASFGFITDQSNTISDNLMVARQVVVDSRPCQQFFGRQLHRHQLCLQDQPPPAPPTGEAQNLSIESEESEEEDEEDEDTPVEVDNGGGFFPSFGRSLARNNNNNNNRLTAVCRGDTGAGLVRKVGDSNVLYALVSRVPQGCNSQNPAIYTNVGPFCQWLEDATLGAASTTNN